MTLQVRPALLNCTIQRLGIGEEGSQRSREQQHSVLLHREEIDPDMLHEDGLEAARPTSRAPFGANGSGTRARPAGFSE